MQGDNDPVDVVEIGGQTGVMGAVYKASLPLKPSAFIHCTLAVMVCYSPY